MTLRLADNQRKLEFEPELTIDHGAAKSLDDYTAAGRYDGGRGPVIFAIKVDGEGGGGPDAFSRVHGRGPGATRGTTKGSIPSTGDWQRLSSGVEIKFDSTSGHSLGSFWALSYGRPESYGIRVGHGTQTETYRERQNLRV